MSNSSEKINFLMYAYLRIEPNILIDLNNKENLRNAIHKCLKKAYQDIKRNVPYRNSIKYIDEMNCEKRKEYCFLKQSYLAEIEQRILERLIDIDNINPRKIIMDILEVQNNEKYAMLFSANKRFTLGLAQKWVNMTLKYLWIIGVLDDNSAKVLDAPIDSNIIKKISEMEINIKVRNWSDWDNFEEYIKVQDELQKILLEDNLTRIQWENAQWIKK